MRAVVDSEEPPMPVDRAAFERLAGSEIRLDAEGRFLHEGEEVRHPGLRAALWRWLAQDPDGRWVLRLDDRRAVGLEVEDAPHCVRSLRWDGEGAMLRLADDSEELLDPATVHLEARGTYCRVKGGRALARLSSAAWATLSDRIVEEGGTAWLVAGGGRHPL